MKIINLLLLFVIAALSAKSENSNNFNGTERVEKSRWKFLSEGPKKEKIERRYHSF